MGKLLLLSLVITNFTIRDIKVYILSILLMNFDFHMHRHFTSYISFKSIYIKAGYCDIQQQYYENICNNKACYDNKSIFCNPLRPRYNFYFTVSS